MAANEAIQLDYLDLATIAPEGGPEGSALDMRVSVDLPADVDPEATARLDFHADIPLTATHQAFDPFAAIPSKDDPEVSAAFKRLDLVEARLARIEKRLMEISLLIARNFDATLQTPLGVPDVLEPTAAASAGSGGTGSAGTSSAAPALPRQTRGKRDRDLDDALEAFLNSLSPTGVMTRQ